MTRILGISGSLRAGSFNSALLRAAQQAAGDAIALDIASLHGIPLYDGELEAREGEPAAVTALKQRILASAGVLLSTPNTTMASPACSRTRSTGSRAALPTFPRCSAIARSP